MRPSLPASLVLCSTLLGCVAERDDVAAVEQHGTFPSPQPLTTKQIVDREVGIYQSLPRSYVGLSVIVVRDGSAGTYHYGEIVDGSGIRPTDYTYYAIGSVTKTFTATLMALFEKQDIVDWNDKLVDHLPDPPAWEYPYTVGTNRAQIEIRDLALHRSGLWRDPSGNFARGTYEADFSALLRTLADCTYPNGPCNAPLPLDAVPPTVARDSHYPYSNWAYAVLAHVLASKLNTTIDYAFQTRLFDPLGMYHTGDKEDLLEQGCLPTGETCTYADYGDCDYRSSCHWTFSTHAAIGYDMDHGILVPSTSQGSDQAIKRGSGTLWSTPGDMQRWLHYLVDGTGGTTDMRTIVPWLHKERALDEDSSGAATWMAFLGKYQFTEGRNLRYLRKVGTIDHQFSTFLGISDDRRVGIIVMSNLEPYDVTDLGERLIDALH